MKHIIGIFLMILFQQYSEGQSVMWSNMTTGPGFPRTITYGGNQTATVYYSSSATTPAIAPNQMVTFKSGTNSVDIWGCSSTAQTNSFAGSTPGLVISNNFANQTDALNGNYLHVIFSEPVCNVNFNLIDLTSLALSDDYPTSATTGVYNDKVTITATDNFGAAMAVNLSKVGEGYSSGWTSSCAVSKVWHNASALPSPPTPAATERNVTGNTAYVVAGSYNNNSTPPATSCASGGFVNSMDVNVSIGGCVKSLIIHYYNHSTYLGLRNNGGTCNTPVTDANYSSQQTILIGNFNYTTLLPLKLIDFNAKLVNNNVQLHWKTKEETNTQGFDIMHSSDGVNFSKVGYVQSLNIPLGSDYKFDHYSLVNGRNFYQLNMNDKNGSITKSNIIEVYQIKNKITISPNPVSNKFIIHGVASFLLNRVTIKDLNGRNVKNWKQNQETIDVSNLAPGMYTLEIIDGMQKRIYNTSFLKN